MITPSRCNVAKRTRGEVTIQRYKDTQIPRYTDTCMDTKTILKFVDLLAEV